MQTIPSNLTQLQLNASLSFDDVINVFVSKHEEELHAVRTDIQTNLRAVESKYQQAKKDLLNVYVEELLEAHRVAYPHVVFSWLNPVVNHDTNNRTANVNGRLCIELARPASITAPLVYGYSGTADRITNSEHISITVEEQDMEQLNALYDEKVQLTNQFQVVNGALQGLERKVRQIKAYVAAERLKAEGYEALLDDKNIQSMLALPKFD